ncbi:MAG: hypothetical protein JJU02_05775 [Cryomorphaceae bacterium]|nr:hypothetical protein [Cryomorphaceae bacterium]
MGEYYHHILKCLNYFSFFQHPLCREELHKYLGVSIGEKDLSIALDNMVGKGVIFSDGKRYGLQEEHLYLRSGNEKLNQRKLIIGKLVGRLIALFPYVRGVYISGSVSKMGVKDSSDDIDFFVITSPGRLWVTRFLLMIFKKVFLLNSKKYFCINFYKSADDLKMTKHNIYIATEIASLIPVYNRGLLHELIFENSWVDDFLPNFYRFESAQNKSMRFNPLKVSGLYRNAMADAIERLVFQIYQKHTLKVYGHNPNFYLDERTAAHFPDSPEEKLLQHYRQFQFESFGI